MDLKKIIYWFTDSGKLDELVQLHYKLTNKQFHYLTPDGQLDLLRFVNDAEKFFGYLSVGSRSDEVKGYRMALMGSGFLNLLFLAGMSMGYVLIVLP